MRRKRRIDTREVYKWKARLTVHGGLQQHGVNYWDTYSPVVKWSSIRLFLIISLLAGWHTRQLDFVLAYPQAEVECELYMEIPRCFTYRNQRRTHVLKLLRNVYGQKQAGRVWNQHLVNGLLEIGFTQSLTDECVFYKDRCVFLVYVDDTILCGPDKAQIDELIKLLGTKFNISDEGNMSDYLGVKVDRQQDVVTMTQPHLIDQIINDLGLQGNSKEHATPARVDLLVHRDLDGAPFDEKWSYRSVIGKLNFLEKSTRPDIAYAVHQCARYSADPRKSHGEAVKRIGRYLKATREKGIVINPDKTAQVTTFDCWVDASFAGDWHKPDATDNPLTAKSRTGYVIMFANCPLIWASKVQTEIALSTTEAEYVALSQSLREVIPMMQLMEEAIAHNIPLQPTAPNINCTAFEDNTGALELAKTPKMRPRTKHINIKYHHFREFVRNGKIALQHVDTKQQLADIFTKALPSDLFVQFRECIMGW
jgi:hypothetical protein